MIRKNGTKPVEPSAELKDLTDAAEIKEVSASEAEKVLQQDAQLRMQSAAQECQQICEKYRVDIVAQVMIQGNQIQSQVAFSAKK